MITFATFHIDCTAKAADHISENNVHLENRNDYLAQIDLMFRSAAIAHPNCKKVVLTDLHTDLSSLSSEIQIYRLNLDSELVMLSRLEAQLHYVVHQDPESNIVLLDSDMLIQGSLNCLFAKAFDVGLTYRDPAEGEYHTMPFNGGVIFISKSCKPQAIQFLQQVYTLYRTNHTDRGIWWGDQYAMLDAIGSERFFQRSSEIVEVEGSRILVVPCAIYNFSPKNHIQAILFEQRDKRILHFKGERKRLINLYWRTYLAWREHAAPKDWLLSRYNRCRLFAEAITESSKTVIATSRSLLGKVLYKSSTILSYRP